VLDRERHPTASRAVPDAVDLERPARRELHAGPAHLRQRPAEQPADRDGAAGLGATPNAGSRRYFFGCVGIYHGGYYTDTQATRTPRVSVSLAIPLLATLPLALPGVRLWPRQSHAERLRRLTHCPSCGYDLRASPERCSECGAAATAKLNGPKNRIAEIDR
jgi:hypothetical protein